MWSSKPGFRWLVAVLLLSLAGCGFRFRATPDFPPQMAVIHIDATDRYSPFYRDLVAETREIVVQVNGRVRGRVSVAATATEDDVRAAALADDNVQRFVGGQSVKKVIVVPGRLVNVVV